MNRRPHVRRVASDPSPLRGFAARPQRRVIVQAPVLLKQRDLVQTRCVRRSRFHVLTLLPFPRCMCRDGAKAAVHFEVGNGNGRRKKVKLPK
jgi:hypothetical protein